MLAAATRLALRGGGGSAAAGGRRSAFLRSRSAPAAQHLLSALSAALTDDNGGVVTTHHHHHHQQQHHHHHQQQQQRRSYHLTTPPAMPRHSGASAFSKPRPPTRKARKKYHRRLRAQHFEKVGKHSPHGSKAGPRREFVQEGWGTLLGRAEGRVVTGTREELVAGFGKFGLNGQEGDGEGGGEGELLDYNYGDAVLDDLMGNTAHLTSSPDPKPTYLGHKHDRFMKRIRGMMTNGGGGGEDDELQLGPGAATNGGQQQQGKDGETQLPPPLTTTYHRLPSDHDVSLLLRSYRDLHHQSSKTKSIGLAGALHHLFQDARVPSSTFGKFTYSALLTCCANPAEARRVFRMMDDSNIKVDEVSYAILVDLHSRLGDYDGASAVMDEMSAQRGMVPPMTAYTSLLAGCYRAINSGGMASQSTKAEAGKVAWTKWKEMRLVGHDPDVMAYGAMLRVLAAQGRPERAISVLEEMDVMEVKPTTLCFASALRAVSRSHSNALRFQGGYSTRNRRRERIAAHHGRMTRSIVIKAENAEVRQDDGFVSALMMCAATAGDAATARAIYLANKVRRMKHLRTIGGRDHLRELRGEGRRGAGDRRPRLEDSNNGLQQANDAADGQSAQSARVLLPSTGKFSQANQVVESSRPPPRHPSWQERVYGRDTRRLSALLHACSRAMEANGLGNLWAGRDNLGYLDEFSLRAIETRPRPKYVDNSIPGLTNIDHLPPEAWERDADGEDVQTMSKRLRREKYRGIEMKEDEMMTTIDELPDDLYDMVVEPEERIVPKPDRPIGDQALLPAGNDLLESGTEGDDEKSLEDVASEVEELIGAKAFYDAETGAITKTAVSVPSGPGHPGHPTSSPEFANDHDDDDEEFDLEELKQRDPELYEMLVSQSNDAADGAVDGDISEEDEAAALEELKKEDPELYEMLMSTKDADDDIDTSDAEDLKAKMEQEENAKTAVEVEELLDEVDDELKAELQAGDFGSFYASLQQEIEESGENETVDEEEARELFELLRGEESDNDVFVEKQGEPGRRSGKDVLQAVLKEDDDGLDFGSDEFQKLYAEMEKEMAEETSSSGTKDGEEKSFNQLFSDYFDEPGAASEVDGSGKREALQNAQPLAEPLVAEQTARLEQPNVRTIEATAKTDETTTFALSPADEAQTIDAEVLSQANAAYDVSATSQEAQRPVSRTEQIDHELRQALPGLPNKRIKRLREQFAKTLGDPSLLRLVPILRETMPDYVNLGWLKKKNLRSAQTVMAKADQDGLVDIHLLNGMLQVEANAGSLDRAITFHEDEFARKKIKPTPYSDRLVLQMLVKNGRVSRALAFKDKVESKGRKLDIASYGSLVEYYGNHSQLGSALVMLKECIATHGTPPGEKSLSKIRLMCRKRGISKEVGLEKLIGKDPLEWLRHGEEFQKRESSYKGRRDVNLPVNRLLQI